MAVPHLIARLRDSEPLALLGHSLGGLIALEALNREPDLPVTRVVCLGSPLRGSHAARISHGGELLICHDDDCVRLVQ